EHWRSIKLPVAGAFAARPALAVTADDIAYIAWDEYDRGSYRCAVARVADGQVTHRHDIAVPDHHVGRPALTCGHDGSVYLAYCLERLVEADGGAVGHHSRIVTARRDASSGSWLETG